MENNIETCSIITKQLSQVGLPEVLVWSLHAPASEPSHSLAASIMQDMMDCVLSRSQRTARFPRCDSSDCLVCQGQRTFCSEAVTSHVSCWLERRMSVTHSSLEDSLSASVPSDDASVPVQQQSKRVRREGSQDSAGQQQQQAAVLPAASHLDDAAAQQHDGLSFSSLLGCQPWAWRPEWADWQQPAPCRMVQLASLQSPAELSGGAAGQQPRRGDMICGLEFSLDGQMLATAGVSKQVRWCARTAVTVALPQESGRSVVCMPPAVVLGMQGSSASYVALALRYMCSSLYFVVAKPRLR
jgi:hypothetical protein